VDKIIEFLEYAPSRPNNKILYCYVKTLRGISESGLVSVKVKGGVLIRDKENFKEKWKEHYKNVLNRYKVTGNNTEKNEKVCDNFERKEDSFC